MRISEGVLSPAVLAGGAALAVVGGVIGLKKLVYVAIPRVAILSAACYVAMLIHVSIGPVAEHLGLQGFGDRVTHKLSGGEKKLVSLATILALQPQLLLPDEPAPGLDEHTKHRLMHILQDLDIASMIVSHAQDFSDHTVKHCGHVHDHCCQPITN